MSESATTHLRMIYLCLLGCSVLGCSSAPQSVPQIDAGRIGLALAVPPGDFDVVAVLFEVTNSDGETQSKVVPLGSGLLPAVVDPDLAGHRFADWFVALNVGPYRVSATPLSSVDPVEPSGGCARVSEQDVTVISGVATELVLVSQCKTTDSGALDTVLVFNAVPFIEELIFSPSKFVCTDEAAVMTLTASDPDDDELSYDWQVSGLPAGATEQSYCLAHRGPTATFSSVVAGRYELTVEVSDSRGGGTRLSFPVYAQQCDEGAACPGSAALTALLPATPDQSSGRCDCDVPEGITAELSGNTLFVRGTPEADVIRVSRISQTIVVNGGAVPVAGGTPTVSNTVRIVIDGLRGDDDLGLDESGGALPNAELLGREGNDRLTAGSGSDTLRGDVGNDLLIGGDAADILRGGAGNDTLIGGRGNDVKLGEDGSDLLIWNNGDGSDLMEGGAGGDTVQVNGADGAGDDFSIAPNGARVRFQRRNLGLFVLDIGTTENLDVNGQGGSDLIAGAVGLTGLIALDLDGGEGNDLIVGGDGNDTLRGGAGNDILNGNSGADLLIGEAGTDTCNGGADVDQAFTCEVLINIP